MDRDLMVHCQLRRLSLPLVPYYSCESCPLCGLLNVQAHVSEAEQRNDNIEQAATFTHSALHPPTTAALGPSLRLCSHALHAGLSASIVCHCAACPPLLMSRS